MTTQMTLGNIPTAPLLMAALALVGGYGAAVSIQQSAALDYGRQQEASQQNDQLASDIHMLIKKLKEMESGFWQVSKNLMAQEPVRLPDEMNAPEVLEELSDLLKSIRGMELALRSTEVPQGLEPLNMSLRRAMAKARENVAILHSLTSQIVTIPVTVESNIDLEGLRALADHSTKRLIELANA